MIKYNEQFNLAILALRKVLVNCNYDLLIRELKLPLWYFREPGFVHYGHSINNRLEKLGKKNELLVRLFSLAQEVDLKAVETYLLSKDLINELVNLGLLLFEGDKLRTDAYSIIPFLGTYSIATIGTARSMGAFIGRQSYLVATKMFEHNFESALDLGSGCGVLSLLAARRAKRVVGVDILPEAVEVGKTNAVLNNVADRIEFFCGNMYEPVKGQEFDAIFSNTPFLALPEKYNLVSVSSGEDGLRFLEPLIDGLFRHKPKTTAIIANGLGNESQPLLINLLKKKLLSKRGYQARLLIYSKGLIEDDFINSAVKMVLGACKDRGEDITKEEIIQDLRYIYQKLKVDYYYGIILEIENRSSGQEIEMIDISNKYNLGMSASLRHEKEISIVAEIVSMLKRGETTLSLGFDEKEFFTTSSGVLLKDLTGRMNFNAKLEQVLGINKKF
jgi:SAM-dependent methyltransferase